MAAEKVTEREERSGKQKSAPKHPVQKVNGFVLETAYLALRLYCLLSGVRMKSVNRVGTLPKPSIILCNHGSFVDFIFVTKLLKKYKPHFIIARLYFYNRYLRWLLKNIGGFPKSMFALDTESTKNCLKVLRSGEILAMMPEARLSTAGRFEDIQPNTYSFIKKSGVPVYTVKFGGDYLADPKWGSGIRRGDALQEQAASALREGEGLVSIGKRHRKGIRGADLHQIGCRGIHRLHLVALKIDGIRRRQAEILKYHLVKAHSLQLADDGHEIIQRTSSVRVKDACIAWTNITIEPVRFNRGFYSVNIKFYIKLFTKE